MKIIGRNIAVIGLGYVGLPVALALAKQFSNIVGFDINSKRVEDLKAGIDITGSITNEILQHSSLCITDEVEKLCNVDFFIIAVPTPIDRAKKPDLRALIKASELVGKVMCKGAVVVYESTVYPGITEEICGPILEKISGLKRGIDFKIGYSPERINPGDKIHVLELVEKIVAGEDEETLEIVAKVYEKIVSAGVHRAPTIKVAEAAKVIENTQRDINIALMNELAIIFNKMGIDTQEVLAAAGTKWNFLKFSPGLVGGHCIGVDPYYLTYRAEELGYIPQVILSGRRINDGMGKYIAEQTVKCLAKRGKSVVGARIGVFGLAFKENVADLRNSRVPDIIFELKEYGGEVIVSDYLVNSSEAEEAYKLFLQQDIDLNELDVIIIAVGHAEYINQGLQYFLAKLKMDDGVIIDVKAIFDKHEIPKQVGYWRL